MTIWDCRTHVRMTSMTSSVERTDLDFKISVALVCMSTFSNIFSYETTGLVEAKFHMAPPWDGGTKVCSTSNGLVA